jgi:gliding motility-associated-like protein
MPNAFTPNGDGLNDVFLPKYKNGVEITFQMLIFNKWGEQIFSTNNITKGWDGTYKGVICPEDLYTWTITFSAPGNYKFLQKSPQSGNVMLLK